MDAFRDALDVCGLTDVGYTGNDWTFERKVAGGTFTHVRLDRCVANSDWMLSYPAATHEHKTTATSAHAALLLKMDVHAGTAGPRSFKYELMWERDPRLFDCVSNGWSATATDSVHAVHGKLSGLANDLSAWDREKFGSVRQEIKQLKRQVDLLRARFQAEQHHRMQS